MSGFDIRTEGAAEIARMARQLREAGRTDLKREMTRALKAAADPAKDRAKRNMMAERLPAVASSHSQRGRARALGGAASTGRGGGRAQRAGVAVGLSIHRTRRVLSEASLRRITRRDHSLRATLSSALVVSALTSATNASVTIKASKDKLRPYGLQNLPYDIEHGHWRHPVFGNRKSWTEQAGQTWFAPAMIAAGPEARRQLEQVLTDFANRIARG